VSQKHDDVPVWIGEPLHPSRRRSRSHHRLRGLERHGDNGGSGGGGRVALAKAVGLTAPAPARETPVTVVMLSDTHTHHHDVVVPDGDILIHAGDYALARSTDAQLLEKADFDAWLATLPHKCARCCIRSDVMRAVGIS
jgi:hypothetical protein